MPRAGLIFCVVALAVVGVLGCRAKEEARLWVPSAHPVADLPPAPALLGAPAPSGGAPVVASNGAAKTLFRERCIVCHGEGGKGDGAGAAALKVKPRNYTDGEWQASATDEFIKRIIVQGGAAAGKDPGMPANPDLKDKPEVVDGMLRIVRSFAPAAAGSAGVAP